MKRRSLARKRHPMWPDVPVGPKDKPRSMDRYRSDPAYRAAILERNRKWHSKNKVKVGLIKSEYYKNNQTKVAVTKHANYIKNREKNLLKAKERYKNNKEQWREYAKTRVTKRREADKKYLAKLKITNPRKYKERQATSTQNRRARKRNAAGKMSTGFVGQLLNKQQGRCSYCERDLRTVGMHIEHKIPLSRGGTNEDINIQLTCGACNQSKGSKTHEEYMAYRALTL